MANYSKELVQLRVWVVFCTNPSTTFNTRRRVLLTLAWAIEEASAHPPCSFIHFTLIQTIKHTHTLHTHIYYIQTHTLYTHTYYIQTHIHHTNTHTPYKHIYTPHTNTQTHIHTNTQTKHTGRCLTASSLKEGAHLTLKICDSSPAQMLFCLNKFNVTIGATAGFYLSSRNGIPQVSSGSTIGGGVC